MKTNRVSILALGLAVAASYLCTLPARAADETRTVSATLERAARAPQLAPALEEVVKLTKAGVPESVTLAYVQSSPTPYSLDAQDILHLKERGVSSQVLTAMMQRSDELRRAAAEASKQSQTAAAAVAPAQSPAPTATVSAPAVPTDVTTSSFPASSVSVTYIGYPRYDYYPSYYGYGSYCYPTYYSYAPRYYGYGYCGPRVSFGVGYAGAWHGGYRGGYYGGYGRCR
jgi:hypothetical protein